MIIKVLSVEKARHFKVLFLSLFFSILLQFLLETKRFASKEDSLGFSALCDLPETFFQKQLPNKIWKKILNFLYFYIGFRLSKTIFLVWRLTSDYF